METQGENPFLFIEKMLKHKLLRSKFAIMLILIVLFSRLLTAILGTYLVIRKKQFQRYCCYIMLLVPVLLTLVLTLDFTKKIHHIKLQIDMRYAREEIKNKVISEYRKIFHQAVWLTICTTCAVIFVGIPLFEDEYTFNIIELLFLNVDGAVSTLLRILLLFTEIGLIFGVVYTVLCAMYWGLLAKIQMILIIDKLVRISDGFEHLDEETLMDDEFYQHVVHVKLRNCIREHIKLITYIGILNENMKLPILCSLITSVLPAVGGYFILKDISPKNNFKMIPVMLSFAIVMIIGCTQGQGLEDLIYKCTYTLVTILYKL